LSACPREQRHFDSKPDSGISKTYPQQARVISEGGHTLIKGHKLQDLRLIDASGNLLPCFVLFLGVA
jgi:hypothetical protein